MPFSLTNLFRGGDTITGIEGVIDHTFGVYRLQPTEYGEYAEVNPRPAGCTRRRRIIQVGEHQRAQLLPHPRPRRRQLLRTAAQRRNVRGARQPNELAAPAGQDRRHAGRARRRRDRSDGDGEHARRRAGRRPRRGAQRPLRRGHLRLHRHRRDRHGRDPASGSSTSLARSGRPATSPSWTARTTRGSSTREQADADADVRRGGHRRARSRCRSTTSSPRARPAPATRTPGTARATAT